MRLESVWDLCQQVPYTCGVSVYQGTVVTLPQTLIGRARVFMHGIKNRFEEALHVPVRSATRLADVRALDRRLVSLRLFQRECLAQYKVLRQRTVRPQDLQRDGQQGLLYLIF